MRPPERDLTAARAKAISRESEGSESEVDQTAPDGALHDTRLVGWCHEVRRTDLKEAARLLGVSRSFFYERILNPGLIQPVRRSVRIRPSDLVALVERLLAGAVQA